MDKLKIGDYGNFNFILRKKGKSTDFELYASVMEFDGKLVLLEDNDGIEYLPERKDIKSFERSEKPVNTIKS
jgi:hypothetical protein